MPAQVDSGKERRVARGPITIEEVFAPILEGDEGETFLFRPQLDGTVHGGGEEDGGIVQGVVGAGDRRRRNRCTMTLANIGYTRLTKTQTCT